MSSYGESSIKDLIIAGEVGDGSRIEIGSVPGAAIWQETVASTRDVLLRIVSSYQSLTGVTLGPTLQRPLLFHACAVQEQPH